jgi:RND family efflux transporter MFP subunit
MKIRSMNVNGPESAMSAILRFRFASLAKTLRRFTPAWIVFACACSAALLGAALSLIPARAADLDAGTAKSSVLGRVVPLPDTVADIVAPATGRILSPRERPYSVGDAVKKGDPVAIIEHRYNLHDASHLSTIRWDLLSVMLEARGAALNAKVARERAERLFALGSASGQEVQSLKAAEAAAHEEYVKRKALLDQADAQMQGAELVRKGIFSPIDGTVSSVTVTQGQTINEGVVLLRVVNRKEVGFAARFPESDFRRWNSKSQARVHFDALPGKVFSARAEVIAPAVDPLARTRDVVFRVQNVGEVLRYGMTGWLESGAK